MEGTASLRALGFPSFPPEARVWPRGRGQGGIVMTIRVIRRAMSDRLPRVVSLFSCCFGSTRPATKTCQLSGTAQKHANVCVHYNTSTLVYWT